jgi:hypothetical protein
MGRGRARGYNVIASIFFILSLLWLAFVVARFLAPAPAPVATVVFVPTIALLPTETPTFTPTATFTPTDTPTFTATPTNTDTPVPTATGRLPTLTPSPSFTPIPTDTPIPTETNAPTATITPSLTITATIAPSLTPLASDTPAQSPTPEINFTPQPTEPPPSPFPFALRDNQPPILTINFANTSGCSWQGFGGQVFDLAGQPLIGIRVHVFGNGIDAFALSGSNSLYGPSGWEIPVANAVNNLTYLVELQTPQGTVISPQIPVTFPADCNRNLALVNFQQTRDA